MYSRTFASDVTNNDPIYLNQVPALMAKGSISSDTALVESPPVLAFFSKILRLQSITVLCTDGRVKWGVEDVAGPVAPRFNLVCILLYFLINFQASRPQFWGTPLDWSGTPWTVFSKHWTCCDIGCYQYWVMWIYTLTEIHPTSSKLFSPWIFNTLVATDFVN